MSDNLLEKVVDETWPQTEQEKKECELFQKKLSASYIRRVWKIFSEFSGTSQGASKGRKLINKNTFIKNFKNPKNNLEVDNTELIEAIFQRFRCIDDADSIDIQDLVISLTILARMQDEHKLKLIFKLTDVDEDDCLSIDDIHNMVRRIQRNFSKEMSYIKVDSSQMLNELSLIAAERKYMVTIQGLTKDNQLAASNNLQQNKDQQAEENTSDNQFIAWTEFHSQLLKKKALYQSFLPNNFLLSDVLKNRYQEQQFKFQTEDSAKEFNQFRKTIHFGLRDHYNEKVFRCYIDAQKGVPLPGKIIWDGQNEKVQVQKQQVQQQQQQQKEKITISDHEKFDNKNFNKNRKDLVNGLHELVKTEAQKRVDLIKIEEEKNQKASKDKNQANNTKEHEKRVEEMRIFKDKPEFKENFFGQQLLQMQAKRNQKNQLEDNDYLKKQ